MHLSLLKKKGYLYKCEYCNVEVCHVYCCDIWLCHNCWLRLHFKDIHKGNMKYEPSSRRLSDLQITAFTRTQMLSKEEVTKLRNAGRHINSPKYKRYKK